MKAIEAFKDLPADAQQVAEFSRQIIQELMEGDIEPLKFKVFLKGLEVFMDNIKPTLDELAREEAEKYGQKQFDLMGSRIELREVGTKYDYSSCGFPTWERAEVDFKAASDKKKEAEKFLQSLKSSLSVNDEVTGEVVTVHPPVKSSKSAVVITLGKGGSNA
jgi:hypothetical protein